MTNSYFFSTLIHQFCNSCTLFLLKEIYDNYQFFNILLTTSVSFYIKRYIGYLHENNTPKRITKRDKR